MRIIDKTPLIEEDGSINILNRIKGTLQYGFSWYANLQAQQKAIAMLERHLSKKFTLIRNHMLGNSKIMIPIILIGPPGVYVIFVTPLHGTYRAKGDAWGTVSGGTFKEDSINLVKRTSQFAKALDIYLRKREFELPDEVEPILLAVNPALHIASVRPIVRIVMSDAIERFASNLEQDPPVMSVEIVHQIAEDIVNPRPKKKVETAPQTDTTEASSSHAAQRSSTSAEEMGDIDFAFDESPQDAATVPKSKRRAVRRARKAPSSDYFGMTGKQLAIIGIMGAILICLLVFFILGILFFV